MAGPAGDKLLPDLLSVPPKNQACEKSMIIDYCYE